MTCQLKKYFSKNKENVNGCLGAFVSKLFFMSNHSDSVSLQYNTCPMDIMARGTP